MVHTKYRFFNTHINLLALRYRLISHAHALTRRHMGNRLPLPCVCHCCCHDEVNELEAGTTAVAGGGGAKKRRRKQQLLQSRPDCDCSKNVRAARPRHVVPVADDTPEDGDGGGREPEPEPEQEAWPECRVERAAGEDGGGVRVKIVMRRRDIAQLVARLEQRGPEGRIAAGMVVEEVVSTELAAGCNGNADGGGVPVMSPCRDAWRPQLSIIPENY